MAAMDLEGWMVGAGIAAIGVLITLWVHFVRPWLRNRRLRRPCEVHFVIRPESKSTNYVVHDDRRHHTRVLVLPAHSEIEIEIGLRALVPFMEIEFVFGCDGLEETKPFAKQWIDRFSANTTKTTWTPGQDEGHSLDIHGFYHRRKEVHRNLGTHYVNSLLLITRAPGRYKTYFSFLTDEIEGNDALEIVVEDVPRTRMKCIIHSDCYIKPLAKQAA